MAGRICLILIKDSKLYDITDLVESIKWSGRKGSAARSLTAVLVDDDGYLHARSGIDAEQGHQVIFKYDKSELFRGLIMSQTQTSRKKLTFTAYDNGIYLANNKDTFSYENKTASDVFRDCCKRFNIPVAEVSNCTYKIPELKKPRTTAFDTILDALSLDFEVTGVRHYVSCEKGKLSLITRRENILQWAIEAGQNLFSYNYTKSIEDIKTRVKIISKKDVAIAERKKPELEKKIGIFQEVDKPDKALKKAQVNDLVNSILDEKSRPNRTLSVEAFGIPEVISGIGVYIIIKELGLSRTFYVDEDTHSFIDNKHTMNLKLNYAGDIGKGETKGGSGKGYKVGDVVQFKGGSHYISSAASSPAGAKCKAGPAKITQIAKGAKHPYHLIHTDKSTRVYGWVDSGTFS